MRYNGHLKSTEEQYRLQMITLGHSQNHGTRESLSMMNSAHLSCHAGFTLVVILVQDNDKQLVRAEL